MVNTFKKSMQRSSRHLLRSLCRRRSPAYRKLRLFRTVAGHDYYVTSFPAVPQPFALLSALLARWCTSHRCKKLPPLNQSASLCALQRLLISVLSRLNGGFQVFNSPLFCPWMLPFARVTRLKKQEQVAPGWTLLMYHNNFLTNSDSWLKMVIICSTERKPRHLRLCSRAARVFISNDIQVGPTPRRHFYRWYSRGGERC